MQEMNLRKTCIKMRKYKERVETKAYAILIVSFDESWLPEDTT